MNTLRPDDEAIFHAARKIEAPEARAAYLAEVCSEDDGLRREVEVMLAAYDQERSFLESSPFDQDAVATGAWPPSPEGAGTQIGPYRLLEQIGEGGFAVVFLAEQTSPVRRKVALKVLKPGMDTRQVVARFEAERQALAILDHPHIAKVHDGGATPSGRPYFVMELVKGVPITDFCDQNHLTPRQRLELFISVCQAVQHAHQKGIIHRDLKPSNVLVSRHDTTPVVKVIDFGVAKALGQELTDKTLFTGIAQMVGTPLYMSPEQAGMSDLDVDTRSDIYSLGVLLYELLTGTTPLDKERLKSAGYDEIRRVIREEEPTSPSTKLSTTEGLPALAVNRGTEPAKLARLVRGELDWIVMKALEKDRSRRYETVSAFAADVQRYLDDEPVQACPPSAWYRFRKFARRNKTALLTASGVVLAVSVAVAVSTVLIWRALERERRGAYFHRIALADRDLSVDNLRGALRSLEECPEDLREWEWHYLTRFCKVEPLVIRDNTELNCVAFSPDGGRLAYAGGDGTIKIWDSRAGKVVQTLDNAHADAVVSVAFHSDGKHLASRGADRTVKVWDLTTEEELFNKPCDAVRKFGMAYTIAFSPDGRLLAAGTDGMVKVWDWRNCQLLHSLPGHHPHPMPVVFSRDGRLATSTFREGLNLWDPEAGTSPLRTIPTHYPASALAFSRDGNWLASASLRGGVKLWDSTTGELLQIFDLHTGNVECVAISPDGRLLASGGEDKVVRVWDAATGREVLGLRGHSERCACVAFSPDGLRLASASADGTIRIWDGTPLRGDEPRQEILTFTGHDDEIRCVTFSPDDSQRIASAGDGGIVTVWDAATRRVSAEFSGHEKFSGVRSVVFCVAWHPKKDLIASSSLDAVRAWDARTEREVFPPIALGEKTLNYHALAFSPDGRYLVTGKLDGAVQVWDGETGQVVGTLGTHAREIRGVVFSPNGEHLASTSSDGTVKIWDARQLEKQYLDGKPEPRIPPIRARVAGPGLNVAFSPDGVWLATGGEENTVKIWDVETGRELRTLRGHNGDIYAVAVSPDGRWVASGGEDSAVKVWDSHDDYRLVRSFRGHTGLVSSLAFSPDGSRLASGSRDKTAKVWDITKLND